MKRFKALLAAACLFAAPAQAATRVALTTPQAIHWPHLIAHDTGIFSRLGLTVEDVRMGQGSTTVVLATLSDSADMALIGLNTAAAAIGNGGPLTITRMMVTAPTADLVAQPGIVSLAALKGKTVAVGGPRDITLLYLDAMLASAGLNRSDVDLVFGDPTPVRVALLEGKRADAAILLYPLAFAAERRGYTTLGRVADHYKLPHSGLVMANRWLDAHPREAELMHRAYDEAAIWFYDPANRAEAVAILARHSGLPAEDAERSYEVFTQGRLLAYGGKPDLGAVRAIMEQAQAEGAIKTIPPLQTFIR